MREYTRKYGELLKYYREKSGYSIEELSKKLNYGTRSLILWERGMQIPENRWHEMLIEIYGIKGADADFIKRPRPELLLYEEELVIPGLRGEYRFLQISDSHVIIPDPDTSQERWLYEIKRISDFAEDGLNSLQRMETVMSYIEENRDNLDGVLLTGDIIDCPFGNSVEYLKLFINRLPVPYMYVPGNHDWIFADQMSVQDEATEINRSEFNCLTNGNTFIHKKKIGEIALVGLDNTLEKSENGISTYKEGTAEALTQAISGEENVLVLQHCPFAVPGLSEDCRAWWHGNDTQMGTENDKNKENTAVKKIVTDPSSSVKALITGDLHFYHKDMLDNGLPQYICYNTSGGGATLFSVHG